MSEMNFDERIRSEMKDFHLEDASPDWNVFEEKLNLAEIEADLSFDAEVAEHIQNFTPRNAASDWPVMEAKLEQANILRRRVIGMKLTELLIFLLLIATFFHVRPFEENQSVSKTNAFIAEQLSTKLEVKEALNSEIKAENKQTVAKQQVAENRTTDETSALNRNLKVDEARIADLVLSADAQSSNVESIAVVTVPPLEELNVIDEGLIDIKSMGAFEVQSTADNPGSLATQTGIHTENIAPVVLLNTIESSLDVSPLVVSLETATLAHVKHSDYKTWLNIYAGLDVDIVTTPYDAVYDIEAYTQSFTSNRLGASVSFYQNNFELETGLNYSEKNFQPGYVVKEISGRSSEEYTETSLQNIEFKMMQIPIHIKYHFANYKGWHLYGVGGSSLNIIAKANYDIKMKVLTGKPSPNPVPVNEPKIHEKEFNSGLFTEGVLATNSYFSLNGGLGIQRNISKRTALFVENTYQHHIFKGGVGPNMNRLNNFSFSTGVKTLIH